MKVIIELEYDPSDFDYYNVKTAKEYYEKCHKKLGILFNDRAEAIYYEVDLPSVPLEGQRLFTRWGMKIVEWSCWAIEEGYDFFDKTRVVVCDE